MGIFPSVVINFRSLLLFY